MTMAWPIGWRPSRDTAEKAITSWKESTAAWTACKPLFSTRNCRIYPHGLTRGVVLPRVTTSFLEDVGDVIPPSVKPDRDHVYHLYVIRTENRDALREHLSQADISDGFELSESAAILSCLRSSGPRSERFSSRLLQSIPHLIVTDLSRNVRTGNQTYS